MYFKSVFVYDFIANPWSRSLYSSNFPHKHVFIFTIWNSNEYELQTNQGVTSYIPTDNWANLKKYFWVIDISALYIPLESLLYLDGILIPRLQCDSKATVYNRSKSPESEDKRETIEDDTIRLLLDILLEGVNFLQEGPALISLIIKSNIIVYQNLASC